MSEPKYINADDAVRHLEEINVPEERQAALFSANWIIDFLEAFPAAPVRKSKWVKVNSNSYVCKTCMSNENINMRIGMPFKPPYCPCCGAKMDAEPQKEEDNDEVRKLSCLAE